MSDWKFSTILIADTQQRGEGNVRSMQKTNIVAAVTQKGDALRRE